MKKIVFLFIGCITNIICLYSQIFPYLTEVELIKGKVKKIESKCSHPGNRHTTKVISEYDSLGRMTAKINYYIPEDPKKDYFLYDSIGNMILSVREDKDGLGQYFYEYEYDDMGRIINQLELWDGDFSKGYENVLYNDDDLPIQYLVKHRFTSELHTIQYTNENPIATQIKVWKYIRNLQTIH